VPPVASATARLTLEHLDDPSHSSASDHRAQADQRAASARDHDPQRRVGQLDLQVVIHQPEDPPAPVTQDSSPFAPMQMLATGPHQAGSASA
jgi:hypothetical protein